MRGGYVSLRALPVLAVILTAACYDPPKPDCGFRCGVGGACPADYTCGSDQRCHLNGTSPTELCGPPLDAPPISPDADTAPMVVEVTPSPNATDVAVDAVIQVRFSEFVVNTSAATIQVRTADLVPIDGVVSFGSSTLTATFTPTRQLPPNRELRVELSPSLVDAMGTPIAGPLSFGFTTGADTVPPHVISTMPADGDAAVPTDAVIAVNLDEAVTNVTAMTFTVDAGGPITGTLATANNGLQLRFTPDALLPAATAVTVTLSTAITDATGNPLAAPVTFAFTTQ